MSYQPVPIVPFKTGLDLDDEPFLVPVDGFTEHVNGHIKHGVIEKRSGFSILASMADGNPVMGLWTYFDNTNARTLLGFTTRNVYVLAQASLPVSWTLLGAGNIFTSGSTDFVWAHNWQPSGVTNRLYFSNGIADTGAGTNGIWYYNGTGLTQMTAVPTKLGGTRELRGCQLIFSIKQRLLLLNTFEYDTNTRTMTQYPQRARWCQAQGPSNWVDITAGGGGFVDAPTGEHIVSARALQNGVIVFFTNSVWTIEPTSDPALAFRWKKINDFRACDGKMASVGYDRYVVAFGRRGITATDGIETRRIDDRIQAFMQNYVNGDSYTQIFCARDYDNKRFWTLYPANEDTESSGALIYDDDSSSWSLYDISLNVLGYANNGFDWRYSDFTAAKGRDWTYQDAGDDQYDSFYWQGNADYFVGGDTSGNVYILGDDFNDNGEDYEFSLESGEWNPYQQQGIECQLGYVDFYVESDEQTKFTVEFYKDDDEDPYLTQELDCLPDLGFISEVTNVTQANPGVVTATQSSLVTGDQVYIYCVDGMNAVNAGPYTLTVIDETNFSIGVDTSAYGAYTGDGQVFQREFYRTKVWKRAYGGGIGYGHSIRITSSGIDRPFKIFEYKPWFRQRGKRQLG